MVLSAKLWVVTIVTYLSWNDLLENFPCCLLMGSAVGKALAAAQTEAVSLNLRLTPPPLLSLQNTINKMINVDASNVRP